MPNLKGVIYLSNEDYAILVSTGTVVIDGTTLTYDEDTVYITPETNATPAQDGLMSASDKSKLDGIAPGATANTGTVTSVQVQAGTGLSSSTSTAQSVSLNTTISIASGYKLPTTTEWGNKQDVLPTTTTAGQVLKSTNTAGTVQWGTDTDTTYTVATGDNNGQIKVTPSSGNAYNVNVKGLGSAAYASTGTGSGNVPVLDTNGKLNTSVLPALAVTDTYVVASEAAMLALTAQKGDVAVRTDLNKSFILKNDGASTLANWQELLTPTDAVTSVNGATGAVTFNYAGSSSVGGAATSANKINTNAGSATQPVYFDNGIPVATTYSLAKSVPSDAVFTDTNYYPTRSYSSGLQISTSSGVTNTCALYVPYATDSQAGVVTTDNQAFAGTKTFSAIDVGSTSLLTVGNDKKLSISDTFGIVLRTTTGIPISLSNGSYLANLDLANLSADRTFYFPDGSGRLVINDDLTNMVSTSGTLTSDYFVLGNNSKSVKIASTKPTTSSTSWSTSSDVNIPTMKAISSYVTGLGYVTSSGVTSVATSGTGLSGGTITSTGTITLDSSSAGNAAANKVVLRNAAGSIQTEKVAISSGTTTKATIQYNTSDDCIEFIFA